MAEGKDNIIEGNTSEPVYEELHEDEDIQNNAPTVIPEGSVAIEKEQNPGEVMTQAKERAQVLMDAVEQAGLSYDLGGQKKHLGIQAWQILGKFDGATPRISKTQRMMKGEDFYGYEAKAEVYKNGNIIATADAMCTRDEQNWNERKGVLVPEFQLRSMAQTRAASKALRMAYGWIAVLAGYSDTPKEEMTGTEYSQKPAAKKAPAKPSGEKCPKCGKALVEREGKYGTFLGCSGYPDCKHIKK